MNHPKAKRSRWLLILLALLCAPQAMGSVEQNGAEFPRQITLAEQPLTLTGTGVARYRIVFTVYAAGLYLPNETTRNAVLDPQTPRRLEIEYFHTISADDIILAANTKLEAQRTPEQLAALQPAIDAFHGLFQSVSNGDRYRMDYVPGVGTQLSFNGEPVGTVEGGEFAEAYFGIWLDESSPLSKSLRDDLMRSMLD